MKLEEAIGTLELENKHPWNRDNSVLRTAVQLGIEALKVLDLARFNSNGEWPSPLPGETEGQNAK